jgi:molecular chaperone GrpE
MPKKKAEPREIPIKFAEVEGDAQGAEAESLQDEQEGEQEDGKGSDESPQPVAGGQVEAESEEEGDAVAAAGPDLQSQIDALAAEKAALYDQVLRRQAEFENYRKRVERERADVFHRARADVLLEMIPILDNLERALVSLEESDGDAEALRHGVELVHKQFKDALTKFGLQPVESVGCTFDPHLHEAVTMEASDQHQENTIIEEFERGYKIGDRLLRPAKVKVASTPER